MNKKLFSLVLILFVSIGMFSFNVQATTYYTVSFESNGGSAVTSQSIASGSLVSTPTNPTKSGYVFSGWYADNGIWEFAWDFNTMAVYDDGTLYAKWEGASYIVQFDTDGGNVISYQTVIHGGYVNPPANPIKTGYVFSGWYTDDDIWNNLYYFNAEVYNNFTLYVKWIINNNTITFNSTGGSAVSSQVVQSGQLATKPDDPSRDGYIFGGWYGDYLTWEFWFDFNTMTVYDDFTLYARWVTSEPIDTEGVDNVLAYVGMNNPTGKIIIYFVTMLAFTLTLIYFKMPSLITILINILIFGVFIFIAWLPIYIIIVMGLLFIVTIVRSLQSGGN